MSNPLLSIVTPTYKRNDKLKELLKSVKNSDYPSDRIEIIIIDNAADLKTKRLVGKSGLPNTKIITPNKNLFSNGARKLGAEAANGKYVYLLDDDNTMNSDCLSLLVSAMEKDSNLGVVGPLMLDGDSNKIWCAGARLSKFGMPVYLHKDKNVNETKLPKIIYLIDYFPNAFMVRKTVMKQAPLDAKAFPHNWAETDFCLRIIAVGYKIATITNAIDRHHIGYSGMLTRIGVDKTYDQAKSRVMFRRRYLNKFSDWIKFWIVIFPVSTTFYLIQIIRASESKIPLFRAYVIGTTAGFTDTLDKTVTE